MPAPREVDRRPCETPGRGRRREPRQGRTSFQSLLFVFFSFALPLPAGAPEPKTAKRQGQKRTLTTQSQSVKSVSRAFGVLPTDAWEQFRLDGSQQADGETEGDSIDRSNEHATDHGQDQPR